MILYIIKFIICSGLLLLSYEGLVASENMHRFKRFYLLSSLLFSLFIPCIPLQVAPQTDIILPQHILTAPNQTTPTSITGIAAAEKTFNWSMLPYIIFLPSLILLCRLVFNLYRLLKKTKVCQTIEFLKAKLVLTSEKTLPYSFLHFIFINRLEYEKGLIPEAIFIHEATHVQQKHSFDILLLEFMQAIFWFNPVLFFYRKAIRLNHEFLADQAAIYQFSDVAAYQRLLLEKASNPKVKPTFASTFHFMTIKKRFVMMTKSTSPTQKLWRQFLTTLALFGSVLICGKYVSAQKQPTSLDNIVANKDKGVSQVLFDEYEAALKKAEVPFPPFNGQKVVAHSIDKIDRHRLDFLYYSMSPEQKQRATNVGFIPTPLPPTKQSPSAAQLKTWANGSQFRIWKDGNRLSRKALTVYRPTDFVYYKVVAVAPNSIDYGKFSYYVDVMTESYYTACYVEKTKWNLRISRGEMQYMK